LLRLTTDTSWRKEKMEIPTAAIAFDDFHLSRADAFSALSFRCDYSPQKKGGKVWVFVVSTFWV
jgi:hypothetical protein